MVGPLGVGHVSDPVTDEVKGRQTAMHKPAMTVAELDRFLTKEFPQFYHGDSGVAIESAWYLTAVASDKLTAKPLSGPAAPFPV